MGLNVYLTKADSKGYKTAASATAITHDIAGLSGSRIAILAFASTASDQADSIYFMKVLNRTTVEGATLSGITTVHFAAELAPSGSAAASDVVVVKLDNGKYQFLVISTWTSASVKAIFTAALEDTLADGQPAWFLGVHTDTGHDRYLLTASTQSKEATDMGLFYGKAKGDPMRVVMANAGSVPGNIGYLTIGYMNR